jgi:hypothetical protein
MSALTAYYDRWTISLDNLRDLCGPQVEVVESHPFFQKLGGWGGVCAEEMGDDAARIRADAEQHAVAANASDVNNGNQGAGDDDPSSIEFVRLLAKLFTAFSEVLGGLTLAMECFIKEVAAPDDFVDHTDGCVFVVRGVTTTSFTPAGDHFKHLLNEQKWSQYC